MNKFILNFVFFLSVVVYFVSCSKCDVNSVEHIDKQYSILFVKLDSLDNTYSIEYDKSNHKRAKEEEDNTKLKQKDKVDIAEADMEGFAIGAGVGALYGASIGSIVGAGLLGSAIGATIVGIPYSVVYSMSEYLNTTSEDSASVSSIESFYKINYKDPIYEYQYTPLFDNDILCSNVGCLHNYVVEKLVTNYTYDELIGMSHEDMLDYSITVLRDSLLYDTEECDNIYSFVRDEFSGINETSIFDEYSATDDNVYGIILRYVESVMDISEDNLFGYTSEFMNLVSQELTNLDEIFLVNSSISIFYYSYNLWKLGISDKASNIYITADDYEESLNIYCFEYPDETNYYNLLYMYDKLIFVPYFENGLSMRLFLFDAMEQLQNSLFNGLFTVEDKYFLYLNYNFSLDVECGAENGIICIGEGVYELLDIGNDVMYIELNNYEL